MFRSLLAIVIAITCLADTASAQAKKSKQLRVEITFGGVRSSWNGPKKEDGATYEQDGGTLVVEGDATEVVSQIKTQAPKAWKSRSEELKTSRANVGVIADKYAASHISRNEYIYNENFNHGTVRHEHVHSGTVQHEGPPAGAERCEDRTCGCGTRVAQYRYRYQNRYQYHWQCASTGLWRSSFRRL